MISVCIATYNGEKYIRDQIDSILPQLSPDDEIVISDDGSSDDTLNIIRGMGAPLIRIFENTGQHGYTPNFENAIRHAKGDFIFICDQDDIWQPDKIQTMGSKLQRYDLVISDAIVVNEDATETIVDSFYAMRKSKPGFWHNLYRFTYLGCCIAFRREILTRALPFPPNHAYCTHDNWLSLVGMAFYHTTIINDKLIKYRRHEGNTSPGGFINETTTWFKIRYRIYLIKHLILRSCKKKNN